MKTSHANFQTANFSFVNVDFEYFPDILYLSVCEHLIAVFEHNYIQ